METPRQKFRPRKFTSGAMKLNLGERRRGTAPSDASARHDAELGELFRRARQNRMFFLNELTARVRMERVMGIEPTLSGWEPEVLPLNYTREGYPF